MEMECFYLTQLHKKVVIWLTVHDIPRSFWTLNSNPRPYKYVHTLNECAYQKHLLKKDKVIISSLFTERSMHGHFATLVLSFFITKGPTKNVLLPTDRVGTSSVPFSSIDLRHKRFYLISS